VSGHPFTRPSLLRRAPLALLSAVALTLLLAPAAVRAADETDGAAKTGDEGSQHHKRRHRLHHGDAGEKDGSAKSGDLSIETIPASTKPAVAADVPPIAAPSDAAAAPPVAVAPAAPLGPPIAVQDSGVVPYGPDVAPQGPPIAPLDAKAEAQLDAEEEEIIRSAGLGYLKIEHFNQMGRDFRLDRVLYSVNGHLVFPDPAKPLADYETNRFVVWEGVIPVGENEVTVTAIYHGVGFFPFSYLSDMTFTKTDTHKITVGEGSQTTLEVTGDENGSWLTEMANRPQFEFKVENGPMKTTAQK